MKVRIYAKSRVDLNEKVGAYAYLLDDYIAQLPGAKGFKKPIRTMAQADCMAYVNALSILSKTAAAEELETLEVVTDSGVVIELLEVFKFQKHCDDIAKCWRENIKPLFVKLREIKFIKIDRKPLAGDPHTFNMQKCEVAATQALDRLRDITK